MDGEKEKSGSKTRARLIRVFRLLPLIVTVLIILDLAFPLGLLPVMLSASEPILFAVEEWDAVIRYRMIPLLGLLVLATALLNIVAVFFRRGLSRGNRAILATGYLAAAFFGFICMGTCITDRESSQRRWCASNLKMLMVALKIYADESGGYPPDLETLQKVDPLNMEDGEFRCTADGSPAYEYHGRGRSTKDASFIILEDRLRNHQGGYRNFIRTDWSRGHRRGR